MDEQTFIMAMAGVEVLQDTLFRKVTDGQDVVAVKLGLELLCQRRLVVGQVISLLLTRPFAKDFEKTPDITVF